MARKFFSIVPQNFYKPLTCRNQAFYADCIIDLHDYISKYIDGLPKNEVLDIIAGCLDTYGNKIIAEEDDFEAESIKRPESPLSKDMAYRKLVNCGWLNEEPSEDGKTRQITFHNYAEEQILAMRRMATEKKIFLGGYARSVLDGLTRTLDPATKRPFQAALFGAWENARMLSQDIRAIRSSLRGEVSKILSPDHDYNTALKMYNEFMDRAVEGDLYSLQISEGINAKLKQDVQSKLDELNFRDESNAEQMALYNRIIEDIMDCYPDIEDEETARNTFDDCLKAIQDSLGTAYDEKMRSIQHSQSLYLNNAMTKITMMCTEDAMAERDVNILALTFGEMDNDEYEEWEDFRLMLGSGHPMIRHPCGACFLDEASLATPRQYKTYGVVEQVYLEEPETPITFDKTDQREINSRLSAKALNKWAAQILGDKESVHSEEVNIGTLADYERLIALVISADDALVEYEAEFSDSDIPVRQGRFVFPRFTIRKRAQKRGGI